MDTFFGPRHNIGLIALLPLGSASERLPVGRNGSFSGAIDAPPLKDQPVAPLSRPPFGARKYELKSLQAAKTCEPLVWQLLPSKPPRNPPADDSRAPISDELAQTTINATNETILFKVPSPCPQITVTRWRDAGIA
jgi:hypothetical protein